MFIEVCNTKYEYEKIANNYDKAEKMCLFWAPDKKRRALKASP